MSNHNLCKVTSFQKVGVDDTDGFSVNFKKSPLTTSNSENNC